MTDNHGTHEHKHESEDFWTRPHPEPAVLDIGDDVGALILYTPPALHKREIEVSLIGSDGRRIHTAVLERSANGQSIFAAIYPELREGHYRIWGDDPNLISEVSIVAGTVAEVDWR